MGNRWTRTAGWVTALGVLAAGPAAAQTEIRMPAPPAAVEGEHQGAESLLANPALVVDARTWELAYLHRQHLGDGRVGAGAQGDALFFATPVLGPIHLGAGFAVGYPADPYDYDDRNASDRMWGLFALDLGLRLGPAFGLGLLYRAYLADSDPGLDGLQTLDLGLLFRPWRQFALGFAVADLLQPRSDTSREALVPYERRYLAELSVRPWGDDRFTLGASARVGESSRRAWLGAGASVRPVEGLTLRARFDARMDGCGGGSCFDEWQVGTAVEVAFPWAALGGGPVFAGGAPVSGVDLVARLSGAERPAVDRPDRIAGLRLRGAVGREAWLRLVRWVEAAREDDDLAGVLLSLDGFEGSVAAAQELRRLVESLRRAGKPVWCHYDDVGTAGAYLCAAADRTLVAPGGGARLTGIRTRLTFLRRFLDRIGVRAEIVRVGDYKSAPEMFTEEAPTAEHDEAIGAYLDDIYASLTADLAADRRLGEPADAAATIDRGPFTAPELEAAGLADEAAWADDAADRFEETLGVPLRWVDLDTPPERPADEWRGAPRVAVVRIDGALVDGASLTVPLIGIRLVGDRTAGEVLDRVARDGSVAAVVLRIDSSGGSALASDNLWHAVMRLRERKPVVAQIAGIGASGGYYIASAAQEILVLPATLTGSIGIFYGKADLGSLLLGLGVNSYEEGRGERSTMESMTRPYTEDELALLEEKMQFYYGLFLDRVVEGRAGRLTREAVDAAGQGRIWSGARAVELGLADGVGGLADAVARARELAGLPPDAPVVDAEGDGGGLLSLLLGALTGTTDGPAAEEPPALLARLLAAARLDASLAALLPFLAAGASTPQALCPYLPDPVE